MSNSQPLPSFVFLNGKIVPETEARVSVFDRGFLYGDGLFETIRVSHGRIFNWTAHMRRFEHGLRVLKLNCPFSTDALLKAVQELLQREEVSDGAVRITVSRGQGHRGYSPRGADSPTVVVAVFPSHPVKRIQPNAWRVCISRQRLLSGQDASQCKTSNKLIQILARMEADEAGMDEALLLNERGELVESTSGNLFWILDGKVHSPAPDAGALPGVAAETVRRLCVQLGIPLMSSCLHPAALGQMDAVFLTLSTLGVVELVEVDGKPLRRSGRVMDLWKSFEALVAEETNPQFNPKVD